MKDIVVTTQSNFEKKAKEIDQLFIAVINPIQMRDHILKVYSDDFAGLGRNYLQNNSSNCPREYPNGVHLTLEKKCPYCSTLQIYKQSTWARRNWDVHRASCGGLELPTPSQEKQERTQKLYPEMCPKCVCKT